MTIPPISNTSPLTPSSGPSGQQEFLQLYALAFALPGALSAISSIQDAGPYVNQALALISQLEQKFPAAKANLENAQVLLTQAYNEYEYQGDTINPTLLATQAFASIGSALGEAGISYSPSDYQNPGEILELLYGATYSCYLNSYNPSVQQMMEQEIVPLLNSPLLSKLSSNPDIQRVIGDLKDALQGSQVPINLEDAFLSMEESGLLFNSSPG